MVVSRWLLFSPLPRILTDRHGAGGPRVGPAQVVRESLEVICREAVLINQCGVASGPVGALQPRMSDEI